MMVERFPFAECFKIKQSKTVPAGVEEKVFYGEIQRDSTGFLGVLASNDYQGVIWSWYIDDECVEENIEHALGDMQNIEILKPPYVVKKYVEVRAKNTLTIPVELTVYCDGIIYKHDAARLIPMPHPTMVLQEIRDEIQSKNPLGEITDELISVTDIVRDVYDEAQGGLDWTTCSIVNRGASNVYIAVNEWKDPEAPLPPGESQNIDLGKRGAIKRIYLKCDLGESTTVGLHVMK